MKRCILGFLLVTAIAQAQAPGWAALMERGNQSRSTGDYAQAAIAHREAARLAEQSAMPLRLAVTLNLLALDFDDLGKFLDAEQQYRGALTIIERELGPRSPSGAQILVNLAGVYLRQGRAEEAEPLARQALEAYAEMLESNPIRVALARTFLAEALVQRREYREAEPLIHRTITAFENEPEPRHGYLAMALNNLGVVRRHQKHAREATQLFERALVILEKEMGPQHPLLVYVLNNLSGEYLKASRIDDAQATSRRALAIAEQHLGLTHPIYGATMRTYARCLKQAGRKSEAKTLEARASVILRDNARSNGTGMSVAASSFRK